jgi:glycosyltransferase involved in cell wall biosynthesis/SAM-dependent methyltransferase
MKVVVLTTSYPSPAHPVAGNFVASYVEAVRAAGVEVEVVSPASFRHFGVAYGSGIAQNLRAAPWKLAIMPAFLAAFSAAARRAARDADLVHAHWIPSALAARATGKPYVLQVWGTDVELARRAPALVRPLVRGARVVVAASSYLAEEARALGAREVAVVPVPIRVPDHVGAPADPPHVLFAGRLSEEKGILEFLEATEGLPRVIVGDGPLRDRVPEAIGFVPPSELGRYYEAASVVCVPSRREGYGMTAREAMAYGRPVVATRVGGLADLGGGARHADVSDLRATLVDVLDNPEEQGRIGALGRAEARSHFGSPVVSALLHDLYAKAISGDADSFAMPRPWRRIVLPLGQLRAMPKRYVDSWKDPTIAAQMHDLAAKQLGSPERIAPFAAFRQIVEVLVAEPDLPARATWVDIGCGAGAYADLLDRHAPGRFSYLGLDYAEAIVAVARKRAPQHRFERRNLFEPGALDGFDVVFASALLDVLPNPLEALGKILAADARWVILHRQRIGSRTRVGIASGYRRQRTYRSVVALSDLERVAQRCGRIIVHSFAVEGSVQSFLFDRRAIASDGDN